MKATVSTTPCKEKLPYPKLMFLKSDPNLIVLFEKKQHGVCIKNKKNPYVIGYYADDWLTEENWEDFTGSVCLENDK